MSAPMKLHQQFHYESSRDSMWVSESGRRGTVAKTFAGSYNISDTFIMGPLPLPGVKRYFEVAVLVDSHARLEVGLTNKPHNHRFVNIPDFYVWSGSAGIITANNVVSVVPATEGTFAAGDRVMVAYDPVTGTIWWGKNNTWNQGFNPATPTGGLTGTMGANDDRANSMFPIVCCTFNSGTTQDFDFRMHTRASELLYTPPSGFSAWDSEDNPDTIAREVIWYPQVGTHGLNEPVLQGEDSPVYELDGRGLHRNEVWYGGRAYFRGVDTVDGYVDIAGVPGKRRVRLYSDLTGELLDTTWSDPVTGYFVFYGTDPTKTYMVVGQDYTRTYDAVAHDYLKS